MKQLALVFVGGGLGSVLRFVIGKSINNTESGIPYGTFLVNVLGSLLIGVILGMASKNQSLNYNYTLLLATGFCGGFTTFSAFAYENQFFLKSGDFTLFFLYTVSSLILSFIAVFIGLYLVKFI